MKYYLKNFIILHYVFIKNLIRNVHSIIENNKVYYIYYSMELKKLFLFN